MTGRNRRRHSVSGKNSLEIFIRSCYTQFNFVKSVSGKCTDEPKFQNPCKSVSEKMYGWETFVWLHIKKGETI